MSGVPPVPATPIDAALRALTRSANKGRLWFALAALGLLIPGRSRRAVLRGVGALAVTSTVVNAALKPLAQRPRPLIEHTPLVRRLARPPQSASFPSGHAASAAAFTTGVALESPVAGAALAPLAAAVAYSRVHVGVHHLSDVVGGAAIGAGLALATQRWWPVRRAEPAYALARAPAPALVDGAGLVVLVNPRADDQPESASRVRELLPAAKIIELTPELDPAALLDCHAAAARAFGAAGGDGTVAAVAAAARRHGLPLAVFPAGTRNHFARDLGVATFADTAGAVTAGSAAAVDLAEVNGVLFVNNAVIGAYPEMVRRRRQLELRLGKLPAMAVAAGRVLRDQRPIRLLIDGRPTLVWTLFVGNCRYARGAFPTGRPLLTDGWLDLHYLRADVPLSRTRAVLSTLVTVRGRHGVYRARLATRLEVGSVDGLTQVAYDGEAGEQAAHFRFRKLADTLTVYRPEVSTTGAPELVSRDPAG